MDGILNEFKTNFLLNFVPLFITLDAIGVLPIIYSVSSEMSIAARRKLVDMSILTAALVGLVFLFFGKLILYWMGIEVGAFAIAGGIILLVLSIRYMTSGHFTEVTTGEMIAVVPIGTPLIMGPATITTLLLLSNAYPLYIVLVCFILNIFISWVVYRVGDRIMSLMGAGGVKAISRIFNLLLAALAVNMIIRGFFLIGILKTGS